jgi:hypothetical protein
MAVIITVIVIMAVIITVIVARLVVGARVTVMLISLRGRTRFNPLTPVLRATALIIRFTFHVRSL